MHVAIFHYHFNRGGVTQVMLNQLRSLDAARGEAEPLKVALIHGGRRKGVADQQISGFRSIDLSIQAISALDYDRDERVHDERLAGEIRCTLDRLGFSATDTLLHVHNHALGKNVSLPGAIRRLAQDGYGILLQLHDFAEDLRPKNYQRLSRALGSGGDPSTIIYPQSSRIHYAVLNRRDFQVLSRAGIDGKRLHRLPNAVGDLGPLPDREAARKKLQSRFGIGHRTKYVVYPVRGIRRKNVGEMLLWSAAVPGDIVFAMTLPPLNPAERPAYEHWTGLAKELNLPCVFETGAPGRLEFTENLAAADRLLTTSIAEGFGMVFLEAWLAGRNLVGRDLPEITSDFVDSGLRLENLYAKLPIPIDWVGRPTLHGALAAAYRRLLDQYGVASISSTAIEGQVANLLQTDTIDFAALNARQQSQVIRRVHQDPYARRRLVELTPQLEQATSDNDTQTASVIRRNSDVVRRVYSSIASGERLWHLYQTVMASAADGKLTSCPRADRILDAYLDISRLYPIRFDD